MPTISRFYGISIRMYADDHNPPHVHADMAEYNGVIFIENREWRDAPLPGRARKLVEEWVWLHRAELLENWRLCRANQPPIPISPLP